MYQHLIIRRQDRRIILDHIIARIDTLHHQQRLSQIPPTLHRNPLKQLFANLQLLQLRNILQNAHNLALRRRRNPHKQRSRPDRPNDICRAVRNQDQPQIGRVFFHSPTQRGLGIAREVVGFVDDDDLEALFGADIDLLGLGDFFEKGLDHDTVVVADVGGGYFEVEDGGDDVEFEFAVRCGLEDSGVDFDLGVVGLEMVRKCNGGVYEPCCVSSHWDGMR